MLYTATYILELIPTCNVNNYLVMEIGFHFSCFDCFPERDSESLTQNEILETELPDFPDWLLASLLIQCLMNCCFSFLTIDKPW